jgi:hypothetical protein
MGEMRKSYKLLVGNLRKIENSENLGVHQKLILLWIAGKYGLNWSDSSVSA